MDWFDTMCYVLFGLVIVLVGLCIVVILAQIAAGTCIPMTDEEVYRFIQQQMMFRSIL